jgi:uncharacterized repeat protein (TIGR01451 family)
MRLALDSITHLGGKPVSAIRRPLLRIGLSLLASLSLVLSAAPPTLGLTDMAVEVLSSPNVVTGGKPVSYVISVGNKGSSTVNHATLEAVSPSGLTYVRAITTQGTCNAAPARDPFCTLGQYAPDAPSLVVLIFDTAPTQTEYSFTFEVTVRAGEGPNDQQHSAHDDTFTAPAETTVLEVSDDFTIHYIVPEGDEITTGGVLGATALSPANPQGTQVTVPATPFGLPAWVEESEDPNGDYCPDQYAGKCFGQVSEISVGGGIPLDPYLIVQIRFDDSEVQGLNDRRLVMIHWFDPPADPAYEEITTICSDATPAAEELPCRLPAQRMEDRDWLVTIYLESNGFVIGKG